MIQQVSEPVVETAHPESVYHQVLPWIELPLSAMSPAVDRGLAPEKRQLLEQGIRACQKRSSGLLENAFRPKGPPPEEAEEREVQRAWERFFYCHFAFFYTFSCLVECYDEALQMLDQEDWQGLGVAVDRAAAMWRASGALMNYGVDFVPTEKIYKDYIRPHMPEGFSGTWLREYQLLKGRRRTWNRKVKERARTFPPQAEDVPTRMSQAENTYYKLHFRVMQACVPELMSKLQEYEIDHGHLSIENQHLRIFDDWFHVKRSEDLKLSEFVQSACSVFSYVLDDLASVTRLEDEDLSSISEGLTTWLEIANERLGRTS